MYRLPTDAAERLSYLKGAEVEQVCVGKFDLQFHLHPRGKVSVWSRCELLSPDGNALDTWDVGRRTDRFLFAELLGGTVADILVEDARTLTLRFADGRRLAIHDTSDQYESFSVDDVYV